jgi:hypothetical protein
MAPATAHDSIDAPDNSVNAVRITLFPRSSVPVPPRFQGGIPFSLLLWRKPKLAAPYGIALPQMNEASNRKGREGVTSIAKLWQESAKLASNTRRELSRRRYVLK